MNNKYSCYTEDCENALVCPCIKYNDTDNMVKSEKAPSKDIVWRALILDGNKDEE